MNLTCLGKLGHKGLPTGYIIKPKLKLAKQNLLMLVNLRLTRHPILAHFGEHGLHWRSSLTNVSDQQLISPHNYSYILKSAVLEMKGIDQNVENKANFHQIPQLAQGIA